MDKNYINNLSIWELSLLQTKWRIANNPGGLSSSGDISDILWFTAWLIKFVFLIFLVVGPFVWFIHIDMVRQAEIAAASERSQETVQAPVFQPYWYTDANGNTYLVSK